MRLHQPTPRASDPSVMTLGPSADGRHRACASVIQQGNDHVRNGHGTQGRRGVRRIGEVDSGAAGDVETFPAAHAPRGGSAARHHDARAERPALSWASHAREGAGPGADLPALTGAPADLVAAVVPGDARVAARLAALAVAATGAPTGRLIGWSRWRPRTVEFCRPHVRLRGRVVPLAREAAQAQQDRHDPQSLHAANPTAPRRA